MGRVVVLDECASTNIEVQDRDTYRHGDAVIAIRQTAGRGQRGNKWESAPGENLTFSMVLEPDFLRASEQFLISEICALSVVDTLAAYGIDARIKWTNDVYVGDGKICGMLLEHDLKGDMLARTIAGIGINVNQTNFPSSVPNPVSIALLLERKLDIREVFDKFSQLLFARYDDLKAGNVDGISNDYHRLLYRRDEPHKYIIPGEGEVVGVIRSVEPSGRLMVEVDGAVRGFLFKEIEYII